MVGLVAVVHILVQILVVLVVLELLGKEIMEELPPLVPQITAAVAAAVLVLLEETVLLPLVVLAAQVRHHLLQELLSPTLAVVVVELLVVVALLVLVALAVVVLVLALGQMQLVEALLEQQTLEVGAVERIVMPTHQQAQMVVQVLSLFVMQILLLPQLLQQAHQQLPCQADSESTNGILQVQLHSEQQHGTFCTSRKRHRHTSYCGRAGCY
jgi:hypothetical protein